MRNCKLSRHSSGWCQPLRRSAKQTSRLTARAYLDDTSGNGPTLKLNGADVLATQTATWTPIGAEKTASGYEVAWKVAGADQYTIWNTDSNGAYTSDTIGVVSGSSPQLESAETLFQQDLNGDGSLGTPH